MRPSPARIILGEDNPQDVYLIRLAIEQHGIKGDLQVYDQGAQLLRMLGAISEGEPAPDLVVLDLNLPGHDGLELLSFIRRQSTFANVPVVILTSSESPGDTRAAAEGGATEYIRKPTSLDEFLAIGGVFRMLLDKRATKRLPRPDLLRVSRGESRLPPCCADSQPACEPHGGREEI